MSFITGYNIIVISHEKGKLDAKTVYALYADAVSGSRTQTRQDRKISADTMALFKLSDAQNYIMVIRRRVGENSETQRVRLCEFGLEGLFEPVFTSGFIMWNHADAQELRDILVELQNGIKIDTDGEDEGN